MSIWDDFGVDVDKVEENPFAVPLDEYPTKVDAEVKRFKSDGPEFFVFHYVITGGAYSGKGADKIFPLKPLRQGEDPEWEAKNARTLSNLKKTLIELGMSVDQIRQFKLNPQYAQAVSAAGVRGTAKIGPQKNNPQFNAVYEFAKAASPTVSSAPSVVQSVPNVAVPAMAGLTQPAINPQTVPGSDSGSVGSLSGLANLFNSPQQ